MLDTLRQDARFALRQLRVARSFSVAAIGTLALGIGATVAVFSAVEAVVLRPFPFTQPDRVVNLHPARNGAAIAVSSNLEFATWRELPHAFDSLVAISQGASFILSRADAPEVLTGARASSAFTHVLGVAPEIGRGFSPADEQPGAPHVVLLSHTLWMRDYNGTRTVLGQTVRLDGDTYVIIGVMPASLDAVSTGAQLWVPLTLSSTDLQDFKARYLQIVGRLAPGVSLAQATAAVDASERKLAAEHPMWGTGYSGQVTRFSDDMIGAFRTRLFILLGAVSFVFLIACVNVTNLLLSRGSARVREMGVRTALGANRGRLIQQLLTESAVLSACAGAAGIALAYALMRAVVAASPPGIPRIEETRIDGAALLIAILASAVCSVLVGLFPAFRSAKPMLRGGLSETKDRGRARGALVAAEVALAMALLAGAGLLIRSAWAISHVDPGFDGHDVLTAQVLLPPARYDFANGVVTYRAIRDAVARTPGVQQVSLTSSAPLTPPIQVGIGAEGRPYIDGERLVTNGFMVSPDYFATMKLHMRSGRDFAQTDNANAPLVAIINQALAKKLWPNEDAVGKRFEGMDPSHQHLMQVVGVIDDARTIGLEQAPTPEFYIPFEQVPPPLWSGLGGSLIIAARTATDPAMMERALRQAVASVDPSLPLAQVATMDQLARTSRATARFNTLLLGLLGAIALLLASVGVYGVIAYSVAQRTREIALRMALGATPPAIAALVVRHGLTPIVIGAVIGGVLSAATTRLLREQLYGVGPGDPTTILAIATLLLFVSLVAACIPTWRAMTISPARALTA